MLSVAVALAHQIQQTVVPCLSSSESLVVPVAAHDASCHSPDIRRAVYVANDELDLCVFVEPNQNRKAVAPPGINDHLHSNVRKHRLTVLQDDPFKPWCVDVCRTCCVTICELCEVS